MHCRRADLAKLEDTQRVFLFTRSRVLSTAALMGAFAPTRRRKAVPIVCGIPTRVYPSASARGLSICQTGKV